MNPLISVIVPTYNRLELLRRALASIDAQTYRNYEAIVINDGGVNAAGVVKDFKKTVYIDLPRNCGLPAARNAGLYKARGDWIAYLDDDDWFYPCHLDALIKWANQYRFIYTNADYLGYNDQIKPYMDVDPAPGNILSHNITPVCCVLHDYLLLAEAGYFDETLHNHEDWDLWIRMSKVTDMFHVKSVTCCIDRSRDTMSVNQDAMIRGMQFVKARYRGVTP